MKTSDAPARTLVGGVSEFEDGDRRLVQTATGKTIGVFRVDGGFVAYENTCLHQGGPVCEGRYFPKVTAEVDPGGSVVTERHDRETPHLVCPWHGWEYDLRTGRCVANPRWRLRSYDVEIVEEQIYVVHP